MISFGSEFHSLGAVAENDLSKREVLDLGTDREPFVADRKLHIILCRFIFLHFPLDAIYSEQYYSVCILITIVSYQHHMFAAYHFLLIATDIQLKSN